MYTELFTKFVNSIKPKYNPEADMYEFVRAKANKK